VAGTTDFIEDASVMTASKDAPTVHPISVFPIDSEQYIKDWLARPYAVGDFDWSTGDTFNDVLYSTSVVAGLTANSVWMNKIQGYNLIRGTAVFRIQLNSNPFQIGRLLCHFLPFAAHLSAGHVAGKNLNLTTKSQQPHVELDCRDTSAILRIPYISPTEWYNRYVDEIEWGTFYVSVLDPLKTGATGQTTANVTIWMHFEDFEVAAPVLAQMAGKVIRAKKMGRARNARNSESEQMNTGTISSALSLVSEVADSVSSVPFISEFAKPVAWASDLAAGLASMFGFSKPLIESPQNIVIPRSLMYSVNQDGVDGSYPLGASAVNQVSLSSSFAGTNIDEMSMKFLCEVPAYVLTFALQTADLPGDQLTTFEVGPADLYFDENVAAGAAIYQLRTYPPLGYIGQLFRFYRGSIKLHLKIIKSDYHSARIIMAFNPTTDATTVSNNLSLTLHREIIDVRQSSEHEIIIPYLLESPYVPVTRPLGTVTFNVLNQLKNPETTSGQIDFQVWVSAGPDFEFAVPGEVSSRFWPLVPQADFNEETQGVIKGVGASKIDTTTLEPAVRCIGERVTSIKQLLLRHVALYTAGATQFAMYPYYFDIPNMVNSAAPTEYVYGDYHSYLATGFALWRGSFVFSIENNIETLRVMARLVPDPASTTFYTTTLSTFPSSSLSPLTAASFGSYTVPFVGANGNDKLNVRAPYYGSCESSLVHCGVGTTRPVTVDAPASRLIVWAPNTTTNLASTSVVVRRAVADDFQYGYFTGFMPVYKGVTI